MAVVMDCIGIDDYVNSMQMPVGIETMDISPDMTLMKEVIDMELMMEGEEAMQEQEVMAFKRIQEDMLIESAGQNESRGRSAERQSAVGRRAQSVDSAKGKPSREQLMWEVEQYRDAFLEARAQAESLHEELVQMQEAVLSTQNDEGRGAAASRYMARLARDNFRLGAEVNRLEQYVSQEQAKAEQGCQKRSSSCDSERSTASSWVSARSSPVVSPREEFIQGPGLQVSMRKLNFKKVQPDLSDDDEPAAPTGSDRQDTTRSGTSESSEVDSESESDHQDHQDKDTADVQEEAVEFEGDQIELRSGEVTRG